MEPMFHDSAVVTTLGGGVVANGSQGVAAGAASAPAVTGLIPAGADDVSLQAAASFASEGVRALGMLAAAQEELMRAGSAFTRAASMYSSVDGAASVGVA